MTPKTAKTVAKEQAPSAAGTKALALLQDKLFRTLLDKGARKAGELVTAIGHPAANLHVTKYALRSSPRFTQTTLKWDIAARWEASQAPFANLVQGLLDGSGSPMEADRIGRELAGAMEREPDAVIRMAEKFLEGSDAYFVLSGGRYGLAAWVLDTNHQTEDDILFYNGLELADIEPWLDKGSKVKWEDDPAQAAVAFVVKADEPVPLKALNLMAWRALGPDLYFPEVYEALLESPELEHSSAQEIYNKKLEKKILDGLKELEGIEGVVEDQEGETEAPEITEVQLDEMARTIEGRGEPVQLGDLMLQVYELEEGERAYEPTEQALRARLRHDPRILWVGGGSFAPVDAIPAHVHDIPDTLIIPEYDFATVDGERFDIEMEQAGLEAGLAKEVHLPIVQDVADEDEPERPGKRQEVAECVLKYHHEQAGTFPLAQIPAGFFAAEPNIQRIVLRRDNAEAPVWVNLETRLIYDLGDLYKELDMPISGGMFRLRATTQSDVFELEHSGETDETASVSMGRLLELLQLKEEADSENLPTFEVVCRMLERQGGMSFPHLFIEMNLVRRVRRMLVASLLSGYACFTRQTKSGLWVFDEKKKDQGFTKSKRKYVVRES